MEHKDSVLTLAKEGLAFSKENPMIMTLILFLSGVNLKGDSAVMMLLLGISGSLLCILAGRKLKKYKYIENKDR